VFLARALAAPAAALGLFAAALPASAAPILLEDGVAFLEVDPESSDGLTAWTLNGVPHVRTQSFWVRTSAASPEQPLGGAPLVSSVATDASGDGHDDTLAVAYSLGAGARIDLVYALTGTAIGAPGDPASDLTLDVTIAAGDAPLALGLFAYTDVDLFNSFADDAALFAGAPLAASVTDSSALGAYASSWSLAPHAVEASLFDTLLAGLLDGDPTALTNALAASGDVTLGAFWEIALGAGESITFSQTQSLRVVPEPGTLLLLAAGLAGLVARRQEMTR
jgi:hypothetical protein